MTRTIHSLVFSTGEPAYAVDRRGTILAWNDAATAALGHLATRMVGRTCWECLRGEDVFGNAYCGRYCPHRAMAARHQPIRRCQLRLLTGSGERETFTISTLTLREPAGIDTLIHLVKPYTDDIRAPSVTPRGRGEPGMGPAFGVLSPRELEVLELLAEGRSTREIATLLSISVSTVRNHVDHLLAKLHCHSRLEAVAAARHLHIL